MECVCRGELLTGGILSLALGSKKLGLVRWFMVMVVVVVMKSLCFSFLFLRDLEVFESGNKSSSG